MLMVRHWFKTQSVPIFTIGNTFRQKGQTRALVETELLEVGQLAKALGECKRDNWHDSGETFEAQRSEM